MPEIPPLCERARSVLSIHLIQTRAVVYFNLFHIKSSDKKIRIALYSKLRLLGQHSSALDSSATLTPQMLLETLVMAVYANAGISLANG